MAQSCVYQIQNKENEVIYVGSTNNLYQRQYTHKSRYYNDFPSPLYVYMRQHGDFYDYTFTLLEETTNLLERERYYIETLNPICNYCKPLRSKEEKKAQIKKCLEKNKAKYDEKRYEQIQCECGFTYTHQNRLRHEKSQRHIDGTTNKCYPSGTETS